MIERGIDVSYETIRRWVDKFSSTFAKRIKSHSEPPSPVWHLDEVCTTINGKMVYLWRAVNDEGTVLDLLIQRRRNSKAALRLLRQLLKNQGVKPTKIVTDRLGSYGAALNILGLKHFHDVGGRKNSRAENSHVPIRRRKRKSQRSRVVENAQNCSQPKVKSTISSTTDATSSPEIHFGNSGNKLKSTGTS